MSSLAAARADNFYFPPGWTPDKGSLNKFQGSHPLGKRAAKIKEGILVVRFEMMYNVWCDGCKAHIGKGVRYNAKKKRVDWYHSTPIWEFKMTCHLCSHEFVIRTDPKNSDYEFVSGVRRKCEDFEQDRLEDQAKGGVVLADEETKKRLATDPLFRAEYMGEDRRRADALAPRIEALIDLQDRSSKLDYDVNSALRKRMRGARDEQRALEKESRDRGFGMTLLPAATDDRVGAAEARFSRPSKRVESLVEEAKRRRLEAHTAPALPATRDALAKRAHALATLAKARQRGIDPRAFAPLTPSSAGSTHRERTHVVQSLAGPRVSPLTHIRPVPAAR